MAGADHDSVYYLSMSGLLDDITSDKVKARLTVWIEEFDQNAEVFSVSLSKGGTALAKVTAASESIKKFLQETHKIKGHTLSITLVDPPDDSQNDFTGQPDLPGEFYPDLIEVICSDEIDTEVLHMYFEGTRSGGKREKEVESVEKVDNAIHVKFKSADDAAAVIAQKTHFWKKINLEVRLVPVPPPKQYDNNKLFVRDVPVGVKDSLLVTFIEARLDLEEETDFTIDRKSNVAIIHFKSSFSDEECDQMANILMKKKFNKQHQLTVERCEVNDAIYISGITESFAEKDALEMYFETSRSGGGRDVVKKIEFTSEDKAKVIFKDHSVIQRVIKKTHKRLGPNVSITECTALDSLELSLSSNGSENKNENELNEISEKNTASTSSGATPKKPIKVKPIEKDKSDDEVDDSFSPYTSPLLSPPVTKIEVEATSFQPIVYRIDQLLAKYISKKPAVLESIQNELQVQMTIDDEQSCIVIAPTSQSPPDWPTKSVELTKSFISRSCLIKEISIPLEAVSKVYPIVGKASADKGLQCDYNDNKITIAGEIEVVTMLEQEVIKTCKKIVQSTNDVALTHDEYAYLKGYMFNIIKRSHSNVKLGYDDDHTALSIAGTLSDIEDLTNELPKYLSHSKIPVEIHPQATNFLHDERSGRRVLNDLIKNSTGVVPYFSHNENDIELVLYLLCPNNLKANTETLAQTIQREVETTTKNLPLAFPTQVSSSKFASFQDNLSKKYLFSATVSQNQLFIVSTRNSIAAVNDAFMSFATEECSLTESISLKKGVWRLFHSTVSMERRWTDLMEEVKRKDIEIISLSKPSAQKPFIQIKGEVTNVEYAKKKILALQEDVKERQVPISRPGICKYFFENPSGQMVLKGLEQDAKVCIEVGVNEDEVSSSDPTSSSGPRFNRICFGSTAEMKTVSVVVGDITEFNRADVIVNAANEQLAHVGGIAAAIVQKGGPIIQEESTKYISRRGNVSVGDAILIPNAGKLPYQAIIHAVGPKWVNGKDNTREIALLKKAVRTSLERARGYTSIAIPAISGGIFGFPIGICADTILQAIVDFSTKSKLGETLNEIHVVVVQNNANEFLKASEKHLKNVQVQRSSHPPSIVPAASSMPPPTHSSPAVTQGTNRKKVKRGSKTGASALSLTTSTSSDTPSLLSEFIKITKGSIINHQEEALVNTTNTDLGFGGQVAKALSKAAGPGLEEECAGVVKPVAVGSVTTTKGYNLKSKHVLHVVLPNYDGPAGKAEMTLRNVVKKCLKECTRLKVKSLSMPSIGAGNLSYPNDVVAKVLMEETASFFQKNQGKTFLQQVHFIIFDQKAYNEFQKVHSAMAISTSPSISSLSPPNDTACSYILPHGLSLELLQGDISCDDSDVIVNTTQEDLQLIGGGVSTALLKKGGKALQDACNQAVAMGERAKEGKVVATRATGDLKCKEVFHISFQPNKKFSKTIESCLTIAESKNFCSISFPAIGTGNHRYPAAEAASVIIEGLKKFSACKPKHMKTIRLIVYQADVYQEFASAFNTMGESSSLLNIVHNVYSGLKAVGSYLTYGSAETSNSKSVNDDHNEDFEEINEIPNMAMMLSKYSEIVLHIYGETDATVARAEKKIRTTIDNQFVTEEVVEENIATFSEETVLDLQSFALAHNVDIEIDRDEILHSVRLHGCLEDVLKVKDKVRVATSSVNQEQSKKALAEAVYRTIRWIRVNSEEEEYDEDTNYDIEQAFQDKKPVYSSDTEKFYINFKNMEERDMVAGTTLVVKRLDLTKLQEEQPDYWDSMPKYSQKRFHLFPLQAGSAEYTKVESAFNKTMQQKYKKIVNIKRIQNPVLYQQYVVRRREMIKRNPDSVTNERWLWHGTSPDTFDKINTRGFDRNFAGKNATVYGKGVYFARDASYSHGYTSPDSNNQRHMYYTQVLTGEFTLGDTSMLVPPPKNPSLDPYVLFDSTVNNVSNPSIFVVYNDAQNYPAYVLDYIA